MAIITVLNQKGGVGKTTTCHHLAGTLAKLGRRVLLVDNDPQASLTQGFWGPESLPGLDPASTVAAIHAGDEPLPEHVIRPTGFDGIDLVPGSPRATKYNVPEPHEATAARQHGMRDFLSEVDGRYDVVLIDCPPNLHLCSWAALIASPWLIVPLQAEDYGAQGIAVVRDWAEEIRSGPNPSLRVLGYLLTMYNPRLLLHQTFAGSIRAHYGAEVFATTIPIATDLKEAVAARRPVSSYKPRSVAAKAMQALAVEMIDRLSRGAAGAAGEAA